MFLLLGCSVSLNEAVCVFAVCVNPHADTEAEDLQDSGCGDEPEPEPAAVQWAERTQANGISSFLLLLLSGLVAVHC